MIVFSHTHPKAGIFGYNGNGKGIDEDVDEVTNESVQF